ncbi:hypothetical protein GE09DRAFT_108788 [Coniochaeta sp. 2T2.1]|nr:hypothetical protein GE09DRAFT_108788 [Coniochaeta sp. 2T2.1]
MMSAPTAMEGVLSPTEGSPPQADDFPPQATVVSPQANVIPPPQADIRPPQASFVPPLGNAVPPQANIVPPQADTVPPQTDKGPPQSGNVPLPANSVPPQVDTRMKQEGDIEMKTIPSREENQEVANTAAGENANGGLPRNPNDVFPDPQVLTFASLEKLRSSVAPGTIEEGVKIGLKTLDSLRDILRGASKNGNEVARWLTRFASIKQRLKETRTVVGILGNTGAGKSTLINAALDEETLIPTNCMRACTAVPTEISFNHDDNPRHSYRGEAEFINEQDWEREVGLLLAELVDPTKKLSKDYLQPDTGAGIAYAKIKAVYPHLSNDRLAKSSIRDLMDDPAVKGVLGTVRTHRRSKAEDLKEDLQIYVDSAEKYGPGAHTDTSMAYWPLVKVVRIYLKAKVLSTGTVLVDLPGVQDSNAARSAVADRFKEECSSIWIVSPINRAVDDKAAKHLLGTSFKLQLTMDGSYSNVTFICSKTDEISVKEVTDKLDADGKIRSVWAKEEECRRNLANLKQEIRDLTDKRDGLDESRDELEDRRSRKRKLGALHNYNDSPEGGFACHGAPDTEDGDIEEEAAQVAKELARIRRELKQMRTRMSGMQADCAKLNIEATARCVEARNKYSADAIRIDFADGVRETREDAEAQAEGETRTLTEPDYDLIAKSLPVFCVSSRGYQFLMGRSRKDGTIQGYRCLADTQIPQLQEHAMRLGDLELASSNKAFLVALGRTLRSLLLWASSRLSRDSVQYTDTLSEEEVSKMSHLDTIISELRGELSNGIQTAITGMRTKARKELLEPITPMCFSASSELPGVAFGWRMKQNARGGPLRWQTYRSIVVHGGEGVTRLGKGLNFNDDLFVPLKKKMAVHWSSAFGSTFNDGMAVFVSVAVDALKRFHKSVLDCQDLCLSNSPNLGLVNEQMNARVQTLRLTEEKFKTSVRLMQRVSNRIFVKEIAAYMNEIYVQCASIYGKGSFDRTKEALEDFVDQNQVEILTKPLAEVGNNIIGLGAKFGQEMEKHSGEIVAKIKEDYEMAILGRERVLTCNDASPALRAMQEKVLQMLLEVDGQFTKVPCGGPPIQERRGGIFS